ncbi:MAG TPA: serine hydrolase domain-containing protein [Verrucomicrobiae bacterium]|nr:serine hydrolase domain-containing protein [Verrucomicrobiae bacterium]
MRSPIVSLAFAFVAVAVSAAATPALGAGATFTPAIAKKIDAIGNAEVAQGLTPGVAIGVVEDGRLVYARGFGYGDLATHRRVGAGTEFYIGSISKQFTAAAILLLAQNGKLSIDDNVTKYVPELTIASHVTIAQLLQQTSGLPDYTKAPGIAPDPTKPLKLADLLAAVNKMAVTSVPGSTFAYNNLNYFVAGLIVERVSGLPLSDDLQTQIFQPLYMSSTFYAADVGISPTYARGYTGSRGHFVRAKPWDPSWLLGAGGLVSNVYDIAKWDIEMPVLLRVDAERSMFTASGAPGAQAYGMGWVIDQRDGKRYIWHNGEIAGYHTMNALLPDDHVAVIVLANADPLQSPTTIFPENVAAEILDLVAPPQLAHVDNTIVARAKEWLVRLAAKNVDRTQLTPAFSAYLSDQLVAQSNFAALGSLKTLVPIASTDDGHGGALYEFLVTFARAHFHYKFGVDKTGKIDELLLGP